MQYPIPDVEVRITSPFTEPRPLGGPFTHIHGAIDIGAPVNTKIYAPEKGELFFYAGFRDVGDMRVTKTLPKYTFPFQYYNYDVYGGVIALFAESGLIHIMTHSYINQLFNRSPIEIKLFVAEEPAENTHPHHSIFSQPVLVKEGDHIGFVGNAGWSTGPHIHYEIHSGSWKPHADRMNPERLFKETGGI